MSLPLGISVQPLGILGNAHEVVVDYDHKGVLRYWGGHDKGWVENIFDAKQWPLPQPHETPFAKNNAYSLWMRYRKGAYSICPMSAALFPCTIGLDIAKYEKVYLLEFKRKEKQWFSDHPTKLVTHWTNDFWDARHFHSLEELTLVFWEIVREAGV